MSFVAKARVLIADDNQEMLAKISLLLAPHCEVVGAVNNGQLALDAIARLHPDVVVFDISMPVLDGIKAAARLRQTDPDAKVIFLTVDNDLDLRRAALATGALGYVTKPRLGTDLVPALLMALEGNSFFSPESE